MSEFLAEGMWLGTANRIASMRYLKTWGWVARDTTGAEYAQRAPRLGSPMRVVSPAGLRAGPRPAPQMATPIVPWPPRPQDVA